MMHNIPDEILDDLTAYALGALEPAEVLRVERLLAEQPELRQLLAELRSTVDALPLALAETAPAADLRSRTLDHAVGRRPRVTAAAPRRSRWLTAFGALAATASVLAVVAWGQLIAARGELARAEQTIGALQADQQRLVGSLAQTEMMVRLSGSGGRGTIIRTGSGETLVSAVLPQLPAGRTYQLWVISGGGAPVGTGTFSVDTHGYGGLTLNSDANVSLTADVLAITDEPLGGSSSPTTPVLLASEPKSA